MLNSLKLKNSVLKTNNNIDLFAIADFVICDYGRSAFSSIYLDKNILLFDVLNAENVDILCKGISEFYMRKYIPGFNKDQETEIIKSFENAKHWDEQEKVRENYLILFC